MIRIDNCIDAAPLARPTPEVMQELQRLHPPEAPPSIPQVEADTIVLTEEHLSAALHKTGEAGGPSGWTCVCIQASPGHSQGGARRDVIGAAPRQRAGGGPPPPPPLPPRQPPHRGTHVLRRYSPDRYPRGVAPPRWNVRTGGLRHQWAGAPPSWHRSVRRL
jgi:hypothetical protein